MNGSPELSRRARQRIDAAVPKGPVYVSAISVWEVATLAAKRRLELAIPVDEWIARCEALPFLTFVPVDNRIALLAARLGDHAPTDPADRMIVATALGLGAPIVTKDRTIRTFDLRTIW